MQLAPDPARPGHQVERYDLNSIIIDGKSHPFGLLLTTDRLITPWCTNGIDSPSGQLIEPLLQLEPEIVLIVNHNSDRLPDPEPFSALIERQIGCEWMGLGAAIRTYSLLAGDGRRVALAVPGRRESEQIQEPAS